MKCGSCDESGFDRANGIQNDRLDLTIMELYWQTIGSGRFRQVQKYQINEVTNALILLLSYRGFELGKASEKNVKLGLLAEPPLTPPPF